MRVLGFRGPLGAFIAAWGGAAMLTSAPFDNWWHGAYGLDVKILSPPHVVLAVGILCLHVAAVVSLASAANSVDLIAPGQGQRFRTWIETVARDADDAAAVIAHAATASEPGYRFADGTGELRWSPIRLAAGETHSAHHGMRFSPVVRFPYRFPRAGDYRVFVQIKSDGRIETAAFDVHADPALAANWLGRVP